jgi:hypothetical protein
VSRARRNDASVEDQESLLLTRRVANASEVDIRDRNTGKIVLTPDTVALIPKHGAV